MPLFASPPRKICTRSQTLRDSVPMAGSDQSPRASSRASTSALLKYKSTQLSDNKVVLDKPVLDKPVLEKPVLTPSKLDNKSVCSKRSVSSYRSNRSNRSKVESWMESSIDAGRHSAASSGAGVEKLPNLPVDENMTRAIEALAAAFRHAAVVNPPPTTNNEQLLSRLSTSKDLPPYYGDPLEWLSYKEAYYESTRLCHYSETENMWRLRKSLRGDAKDAVSSLLMSATSPEEVMEVLQLRFGRPEIVIRKVVYQLKKLPPLPPQYHTEIVNFAIKVKNYVTTIQRIRCTDYLRSPELLNTILGKLPTALINKWADYFYDNNDDEFDDTSRISKLELLSQFLYREAKKIAATGVSHIWSDNKNRDNVMHKNNHKVAHNNQILLCTDTAACKFCKNNTCRSPLPKCTKFKRAMRRDRWRFVRANNLCYKCLETKHEEGTTCSAGDCDVEACGGPHHRLLHWTRPHARPAAEAVGGAHSGAQQSEAVVNHAITTLPPSTSAPKVILKIVPVTIYGPKGASTTHALLDDGATVSLMAADLADEVGLHGECVPMRASSAWDSAELVCTTEILNFDISNSVGDKFKLRARKLKELNLPLQFTSILPNFSNNNFCNFNDDDSCNENIMLELNTKIKPRLLIGQDNYDLIAPIVCKKSGQDGPFVTRTKLGWCVHGALYNAGGKQQQKRAKVAQRSLTDNSYLLHVADGAHVRTLRRCLRCRRNCYRYTTPPQGGYSLTQIQIVLIILTTSIYTS